MLLPGNMCDARLWQDILPALAGWDVAHATLDDDDTIDAMAERCLEAAAGSLVPIGFSMGGIVALAMAARSPERIAAIGLLDTNPSGDLPERAAVRPRQQAEVRSGGLERVVVEELKPNYLAPPNRGNVPLRTLLRDMAMRLGPEVFVRQSEALRTRRDQRAVLPRLSVPAFIACGEQDDLCPPDWHRAMADTARMPTLHVVPGAGHMLPLEQPIELSHNLAHWLTTLEDLTA